MYAIRNKKTKEWVYGTDYQQFYPQTRMFKQRTSEHQALTYNDKEYAEIDMMSRRMSRDYEVVEVKLTIVDKEDTNE